MHISLDLTPTFKGDALEHSQNGIGNVIKVGYTIVWIFSSFCAEVASWASIFLVIWVTDNVILMNSAILDRDTPLLKHSVKHLCCGDSEDDEEEQKNGDCIFQQWQSRDDSNNQNLKTFDTGNCLEGSHDSEHSQT